MEKNLSSTYYKSFWRRRRRINVASATHNKNKLQILSLKEQGAAAAAPPPPLPPPRRRLWRLRRIPKLRLKSASPNNFLAKCHDAFADLMIYLNKKIPNPNSIHGGFLANIATTSQRFSLVSSSYHDVDSEFVLEIYKKLDSSRSSMN